MSEAWKWIGGSTFVAVVLLGSAIVAGHKLDAESPARPAAIAAAPEAVKTAPEPAIEPVASEPEPFVIKRILPIEGPIRYGEWHWNEAGAPAEGPLVMTVDLEARVISVFRDGYEIGAAAVLLGTDDHPTPLGVFPILSKERHNVSEKYGNAPMPWTLRLTHDGVAIHGGSDVERGYASHGCIGTPDEFVSRLFAIASKGDKVIITRGQKAGVGTPLAAL
jgi:lipoprotein-anchoring transpeptidase ErfK/SrfK